MLFHIITIAEGPNSVERQQVAASITKNVMFEGQLASLSESEMASYLAKLDIPGKAVTRLPEFISSGSWAYINPKFRSSFGQKLLIEKTLQRRFGEYSFIPYRIRQLSSYQENQTD